MADNRYPKLTWQQTRLGHWEREIDEAECFYTCLAKSFEGCGRMYFAITGFASITVEVTESSHEETGRKVEEALREAWLRLRYDHPTIVSQVMYDHQQEKWTKSYVPFHPNTVEVQTEEWLRQTYITVDPGMSGIEWCNTDPPAPEVPTLFVIASSDTNISRENVIRRDLVLRSPHDIMDGIGTLQILNALLTHAAQAYEDSSAWKLPLPGSEVTKLGPPLRVAADIPPILTLEQQERLQNLIASNAALRENVEILTVPFRQGPLNPGKHQRVALELSSSDTKRILEASKGLGTTITHIYHAAIAIGIRDLQKPGLVKRSARYINYSLVNERPKCTADYATPKHAAAVYHSVSGNSLVLDLMIPSITDNEHEDHELQEEFHSLVTQVKSYYHTIRDSPDNLHLAPAFWSMGTPHISNPASTSPRPIPAPNPLPSVSISSMGVVDKIISPQQGVFKVSSPWVTGEELGTGLGVFLGTWEGKLGLSAAYNDAWHGKEEVENFLKHIQGVVWRGLGLGDCDMSGT
ncbi:hypothetical protein BKA66DRAFT_471841 [Pyrenochaeta sp. MPI-SDFR-AT-0127]|nr:hypothetical protein BKA66DRAFT_471841 [Pyrenochaeta sp. MPI-SDFR-AT-0127]